MNAPENAGQENAAANPYPPVGFKSPDGAQPPPQPGGPPGLAGPAHKPILRLVQKFWHACTTAPAAPQATPGKSQASPEAPDPDATDKATKPRETEVIEGNQRVIDGNPPVTSGSPATSHPTEAIRIEAAKAAGAWLFSTPPAPLGIEGVVLARDPNEAIQKVALALRSLSVLCKHPDGLVRLSLVVSPDCLVNSTTMTPDIDGEREDHHAQIV